MDDRVAALSQRQRECLRLVAQGFEAKEIGRALGISDLTVKNHLSAARATLGVARSIEAARIVIRAEARAAEAGDGARADAGASGTSTPAGIADRAYFPVDGAGQPETVGDDGEGLRDGGVWNPDWLADAAPLDRPARRGHRNDLGIGARLAIVVILTVLLIAAVGFFVDASRGLRF